MADPDPLAYRDIAMTPVDQYETTSLGLFTATDSTRAFVRKRLKADERRIQAGA